MLDKHYIDQPQRRRPAVGSDFRSIATGAGIGSGNSRARPLWELRFDEPDIRAASISIGLVLPTLD
jgi:hypothetical protein